MYQHKIGPRELRLMYIGVVLLEGIAVAVETADFRVLSES